MGCLHVLFLIDRCQLQHKIRLEQGATNRSTLQAVSEQVYRFTLGAVAGGWLLCLPVTWLGCVLLLVLLETWLGCVPLWVLLETLIGCVPLWVLHEALLGCVA